MTKLEFIISLGKRLQGLPQSEIEERVSFYSEMIDDRIEEGFSEEDAVKDIGSVEEIADEILSNVPLTKIVKEKIKTKTKERKIRAWEIVLICVGFPVWLPLLLAAAVIVIALYASYWAVVVSLWSVFASFVGSAVAGIAGGIVFVATGIPFTGIAIIGAGLVLAGISIFAFFGCRAATKGAILLAKLIALGIKKCFVRGEAA